MRKIEWNKKYGDNDCYIMYQLIGEGDIALKVKAIEFDDGDIDEEIIFIKLKTIKGRTEKAIVFGGEQGRKWLVGEYDYVDAGTGGDMIEINTKIALGE